MSIELYQGENKTIVVSTNVDLTTATEIEFTVAKVDNVKTKFTKTLTGGAISGVTSTQYSVAVSPEDTDDFPSGEYIVQARYTDASGNIFQGKFVPNKVKILGSLFVEQGTGNDYG